MKKMSKRILVTGASGGFGKLISLTLLEKDHGVVASMRGPRDKNKEIADKLEAAGANIVEIDVTSDDSVKQGVEAAGALDVVINNAGVGVVGLGSPG